MKDTKQPTAQPCELYLRFLNPRTGESPLCARCHRSVEDHLAAVDGIRFRALGLVNPARLPILALLICCFSILTSAQTPTTQLVSDCIKGGYTECRLKDGHWYTRTGSEWKDDQGQVVKEPVMPAMVCPATVAESRKRFDFSFVRDWRFYAGTGFSFGVTEYDINTSHGLEATRFYRNDQGMLNKGKYLGVTALTNVALLPLDMSRDHRWRWFTLAIRAGTAAFRLKAAVHNQVKR